jgi:deoxycytidine triphosphate deaminase
VKHARWIRENFGNSILVDKEGKFVTRQLLEPFDSDQLTFIEGSTLDLTIGKLMGLPVDMSAFIGVEDRIIPEVFELGTNIIEVMCIEKNDDGEVDYITKSYKDTWILEPHQYFLGVTNEKVNIPLDIVARFDARTSLMRGGMFAFATWAHPNYYGEITFGLYNFTNRVNYIQRNAKVLSIRLFGVEDYGFPTDVDAYDGKWQGGLVTSGGKVIGAF